MNTKKSVSNHQHLRHWHHIYEKIRRRRSAEINVTAMTSGKIASLIVAVAAGVILEANKETFAALAGAFVILPAVFDLGGSLAASLSAKINHRLEDSRQNTWRVFGVTVSFTLLVALISGAIVSLLGAALSTLWFGAEFWQVFALGQFAILLCGIIGFPLIGLVSILLRNHGANPDDAIGPIETAVFDILTVVSLSLVAGWLL